MPAVTVADITVLPRVKASTGTRARAVRSITTAPQGFEGEGFPVRRAFAGVDICLLYTSPSPRDRQKSRMPSSA